ncbi:hypothetical protein DRN69_05815 [Candidatus Pacearchaeota archaeon]|nr:MAG: hypothetical protein DRN69_05815 [Candidatus Pacearchaeota archaeon]
MSEKRKFARLPIKILVRWKKLTSDKQWDSIDVLRNISRGGICITTSCLLKKGEVIDLEIRLPTRETVKSQGKVNWVKEANLYDLSKNLEFETGIEFLDIKPEDRERLSKFILEFFNPR